MLISPYYKVRYGAKGIADQDHQLGSKWRYRSRFWSDLTLSFAHTVGLTVCSAVRDDFINNERGEENVQSEEMAAE
jgi:hypothetical protein